jgi:hypothetical protein
MGAAIALVRLSYRKIGIDPAELPRNSPAVNFDANNDLPGGRTIINMKTQKRIFLGVASLALAAIGAYATGTVTLRTLGYFIGLTQGTDPITNTPRFENADFAGHNLVNLAMGRDATDTSVPNQVLAMTFACDLSSANLVVYDELASNVVAVIAASTSVDSVLQQDAHEAGPNRAHFVAALQINTNGNPTNGLLGGYFTIAGRLNLDPTNGCPRPVIVWLDRDPLDRPDGDAELSANQDPDSVPLIRRAGLAHLIGVVDLVTDGGTNTVLVPHGGLSIRRELPVMPVTSE